ncbi:uncharacterized protein LOC131689178 [Topomyia yanbarensis]|nr:uncharacterized protein LOC131689178 [Topomyia yanbarensis]
MLLEFEEIWTPEGFYANDTQTLRKEQELQQMPIDQLIVSPIQNTHAIGGAESSTLQAFNIDPNVMTIIPNQSISVSNPLIERFLARGITDQDISLQQPSTSQHVNDTDYSITEQEDNVNQVSDKDSDDPTIEENQSYNLTRKRPESVEVLKSTKKHAASEMKFRCFEINWNKLSDNILNKLNTLQEFKINNPNAQIPAALRMTKGDTSSLINNIVDQLRAIDTDIKASVMETVAKQLLSKYSCLEMVDDDGYKNGTDHVVIKHKMISHNAYLNRFRPFQENIPPSNKGRNVRAGTLKSYWKCSKKECAKDVLSKLRRDEPELLTDEFLASSQSFVRYQLTETKDIKKLLSEYPVLRRRGLLNYHFAQATGVCVDDLRKYYDMKRPKIINYSITAGRKFVKLDNECSDMEVLGFLACLVGENINDLIVKKEIGTHLDEIQLDSAGPLLVSVDMGQDTSIYYVFADQARLSEGTADAICAMQDLLCVHFVHSFKYLKIASKFLELLQQYFLKIIPSSGSKSNAYRVGNKQRIVQKVIELLSRHVYK